MIQDKDKLKTQVVSEIIRQKGFKGIACTAVGLNPRTFRQWMAEDPEFRQAVEDAVEISREYRDEMAEKKLYDLVEAGDTTAVIFYNKTRNKAKGYTERVMPQQRQQEQPKPETPALPTSDSQAKASKVIKQRITAKKTYIVNLLKKEGKYSPELSMQAKVVAQLLVRTEILAEEIFTDGHQAINVETSREGNERKSIDPKEKLYLDLVGQTQKALRALGMNTDSKERKADNDGFAKFMEDMKGDGDDE